MRPEGLSSLLENYTSLSLAGMCKNAGKTTVLKHLLRELGQQDTRVALTSIGRDGEAVDVVTGTGKPRIYVREGTLFATAAGLLQNCDTTGEILKTTGMYTPLGEVVLVGARSDGFIDLAGPSTNRQLIELSAMFRAYSPEKILIDGAVSRRSLCSRQVAQAVILCTGASYHKDIRTVVADTAYICSLLQLTAEAGRPAGAAIRQWQRRKGPLEKLLFLDAEGNCRAAGPGKTLTDALRERETADYSMVWLEGAVTDAAVRPLFLSNISLGGRLFLAEDSSKILLSREVCEKLYQKGARLAVLEETALLAVCINPFSAYGDHFDKEEFRERMENAVSLPVIDVLEDCDDYIDL